MLTPSTGAPAAARAQRAWCLYDWANSAFATTVMAAVLPIYFAEVAGRSMPAHEATARWGFASAGALVAAAVLGPLLGALADRLGRRKRLLAACLVVGAAAVAAMGLLPEADWRVLLGLFVGGFVAFAAGNVLYDALLPSVAAPGELDRVSARGFAFGYVGGGVLLAINLLWILMPQRFGLEDAGAAVRLSFLSVAAWWLAFALPLFRHVPEPPAEGAREPLAATLTYPFRRVGRTLAGLRGRPELLRFLIAFWLYNDGIGTIIRMATIYGREIGIGRNDLIGALLLVQVLAAPFSILFGRLARPLGPQRAVAVGLAGYVGITLLGFFMTAPLHFWLLATLVAMFQGGTQALSRSMFASLVPRQHLAEMFGFYSVSEKLAGVAGPLLFGLAAQAFGTGRFAVLTLIPFFVVGGLALLEVDLEAGRARARAEEDAEGLQAPAAR